MTVKNQVTGEMETAVEDMTNEQVLGYRRWPAHLTVDQMRAQIAWWQNTLQILVRDLSDALTDEGPGWSRTGLDNLRRRVALVLPDNECPEWLLKYRGRR